MSSCLNISVEMLQTDPEFQDHPADLLGELISSYGRDVAYTLWEDAGGRLVDNSVREHYNWRQHHTGGSVVSHVPNGNSRNS